MRIIIYGIGAIGGTLAVMLTKAGHPVIGIARGRQLEVVQHDGLKLRTPSGDFTERFACVATPGDIAFAPDDIILLTMKTQDTQAALEQLRAAGVTDQAIFCVQNGIANDDLALRLFPNVFGVVLAMPATYTTPGEVVDFFGPKLGVFDIGRHGVGDLVAAEQFAAVLNGSGFAAFVHANLQPWRYAKLLMNLGNAVDAVLSDADAQAEYVTAARAEGEAVLAAAGITLAPIQTPERHALGTMQDIAGADRVGSSSAQSLARGASGIETDYLNGEIVLLGRKLGVPTPVNAYFAARAQAMLRQQETLGSVSVEEVRAALNAPGPAAR